MKTVNSDGRVPDIPDSFMVGWLCALAQHRLKFIKTEESYALVDTVDDTVFFLIKTSLMDRKKWDSESLNPIGAVFNIEISQVSFTDSLNTQMLLWFREQRNNLQNKSRKRNKFKTTVKHLSEQDYKKILASKSISSKLKFWTPSYEVINSPVILNFELTEAVPCGISKFKITTLDPGTWEINSSEILEMLGKYVFDEIHSFFHFHHYHKFSFEGNIPLISKEEKDIKAPDNECIFHFLENMGNYLSHKVNEIYNSYNDLLELNIDANGKGQKKISRRKLMKESKKFFENCDNILGIYAFLKSILNSPQNRSFVLDGDVSTQEHIDRREKAAVIDGAYKGTVTLMGKISHHHDHRKQHQSMIAAIFGIWTSVALGVISILLSFHTTHQWLVDSFYNIKNWFTHIF